MSNSSPRLRLFLVSLVSVTCLAPLSGCGAVSLAGSVAGAAVSVGAAVVTTGVKVTGKVIEKTIDVVSAPATPAAVAPD